MSLREFQRADSVPLHSDHPSWNPNQRTLRRAFDVVCALVGLGALIPIFGMIALAIKFDDGGPIFYSQERVGQGFKKFRVLKFRSMFPRCAEGCLLTAPRDARVTRVGRFLRKYKLDELPQLVNVLKGEMQLVGVRPQVEKFVVMFPSDYEELLRMPPGITDLASLCFRNETELFQEGSVEEQYTTKILPIRLEMALDYARARTFRSDLEIILRTVLGLRPPRTKRTGATSDSIAPSMSKFAPRIFS